MERLGNTKTNRKKRPDLVEYASLQGQELVLLAAPLVPSRDIGLDIQRKTVHISFNMQGPSPCELPRDGDSAGPQHA
jgi:hypothetical protein